MRKSAVCYMLSLLAFAGSAFGYVEVYSWDTLLAMDPNITNHQIAASEGNVGYSILRSGSYSRIAKVTDLGGTPVASSLAYTSGWGAGIDYILPGNTLAMVGDDLMFGDVRSDQVYKVNKNTGAMSVYVSKATLVGLYGTSVNVSTNNGVSPAGEYVFYESNSRNIVITTGQDSVSTLISSADLTNNTGTNTVAGGLTYDGSGKLYWGSTLAGDGGGLWAWDGGAYGQVLKRSEITSVTGAASIGFGDIFYAPDGLMYFRDTSARAILAFDPASPASSLQVVLDEAGLIAGPAATAFVDPFSWYAGTNGLAFATIGSGNKGYYALPEPGALLLLGLGSLLLVRRRSAR